MNYYEVLGVATNATPSEIGARYRALKALYEGELATYGLLSDADRDQARTSVEQAYFVLCDTVKRMAYDRELEAQGLPGPWAELVAPPVATAAALPVAAATATAAPAQPSVTAPAVALAEVAPSAMSSEIDFVLTPPQPQTSTPAAEPAVAAVPAARPEAQAVLRLDPPNERMDGAYLRAVRELRAVSLEKLSQALKITQTQLECIETHRFEKLPAPVYLRGFLRSYARHLGIDGDRLVKDYMELRDGWEKRGVH